MANLKATTYIGKLCNLLRGTHVTDAAGATLTLDQGAAAAVRRILDVRDAGRKVMIVGNGGSAAIAGHMHNDLGKAVGVRAMVFTELSILTAISNGDGYHVAYERQVAQWAEAGDLLVAISSSGRSENILRAAAAARRASAQVITFTGFAADNPLRATGDLNFYTPAEHYGYVELAHSVLTHHLTDAAMAQGAAAGAPPTEPSQPEAGQEPNYGIHIHSTDPGHGRGGVRRRRASA